MADLAPPLMSCQHTAYEMSDSGLRCRTCGMTSTEVYYDAPRYDVMSDQFVRPTATEIRVRAEQAGRALSMNYGNALMRPEWAVASDPYANAFPQPSILPLKPGTRRRLLTQSRAFIASGAFAGSVLGSGIAMHQTPLIAAGVAGFIYIGGAALWDRLHIFGLADTVRQEIRAHKEDRQQFRCGAISAYGFGGWR